MANSMFGLLDILLVEDNPGDQALFKEAMNASEPAVKITIVVDGEMALEYLNRKGEFTDAPEPQLIVLDLNLPGIGGLEVLKTLNTDEGLRSIPVVVFSSSNRKQDIEESYSGNANCYLVKPTKLDEYFQTVGEIKKFWCNFVALPSFRGRF